MCLIKFIIHLNALYAKHRDTAARKGESETLNTTGESTAPKRVSDNVAPVPLLGPEEGRVAVTACKSPRTEATAVRAANRPQGGRAVVTK